MPAVVLRMEMGILHRVLAHTWRQELLTREWTLAQAVQIRLCVRVSPVRMWTMYMRACVDTLQIVLGALHLVCPSTPFAIFLKSRISEELKKAIFIFFYFGAIFFYFRAIFSIFFYFFTFAYLSDRAL
jgi:hypothetical protein